jgi:hypothetical protein
MLVFYIARWVSETSVWLAALAATTFSGLANTAAAFCIAGLLHITSSLASTFSGIATTAALVDTAFAAARSAAISAGFLLAAFVSFVATLPIASTGRVAEAQTQPGGGGKKQKERQGNERQMQRRMEKRRCRSDGGDGGCEVCERPL